MCVCLCARRNLCVQLGIGLPANMMFVHWYVLVVFRITCAHALWRVGQRCMDLENHATMFAIHVWTRQRIMVSRYTLCY